MDDNCCRYFERLGLIISDGIEQRFYVSVIFRKHERWEMDSFEAVLSERMIIPYYFFRGRGAKRNCGGSKKGKRNK